MNNLIEVGCPNPDCFESFVMQQSDVYNCPFCGSSWKHDERYEDNVGC